VPTFSPCECTEQVHLCWDSSMVLVWVPSFWLLRYTMVYGYTTTFTQSSAHGWFEFFSNFRLLQIKLVLQLEYISSNGQMINFCCVTTLECNAWDTG
jgi:hypothetical protein